MSHYIPGAGYPLALAFKENLKNRPEDFIVNVEQVEAGAKKLREQRDKNNPAFAGAHPDANPRAEYNRLRQQLYNLQQRAKGAEVFYLNKADAVKGLETHINDLLRQKKQAIAEGHLGQERKLEHQLQLLETELIDAQVEFSKAKHWSNLAARALRTFDGHVRIEELKLILDTPLK